MDALKTKNKVINIGVLVVGFIVAAQIYNNGLKKMELLRNEQETERKKNQLLQDISQLETKLDAFKDSLSRKDVNTVMNAITVLAQDLGLKILSLRPSTDQPYSEYVKSPFTLEISAPDYHALGKFVSSLEGAVEMYVVDRMNIHVNAAIPNELIAEMTVATVSIAEKKL